MTLCTLYLLVECFSLDKRQELEKKIVILSVTSLWLIHVGDLEEIPDPGFALA